MDTYPLLVGFSFAIGMGLIANTILSTIYDLGRRLWFSLFHPGRLSALGCPASKRTKRKIGRCHPRIGQYPLDQSLCRGCFTRPDPVCPSWAVSLRVKARVPDASGPGMAA